MSASYSQHRSLPSHAVPRHAAVPGWRQVAQPSSTLPRSVAWSGRRAGQRSYRTQQAWQAWRVWAAELVFVVAWGAMIPGLLWLGRWAGL